MKLVSYNKDSQDQLAILADNVLYDTDLLHPDLPVTMSMFLNYWEDVYTATIAINKKLEEGKVSRKQGIEYESVELLAPVPHSTSFRNARAFPRQITSVNSSNQSTLLPEFDQYPVFNFANHNCFQSSGEVVCMKDHLKKLDFELQAAIIICKAGKNIKAAEADEYIGGYMIMNTINARHFIEAEEVGNFGYANGKGFATPMGPMLVTPDELEPFKVDCKPGHLGNAYNLAMRCWVNGVQVTDRNMEDMHWTFAEIIEQASYGVQLFPGDIIGSGPVGTGCFLDINALAKLNTPDYKDQWLLAGDIIEMEIEGLGRLINTIVKEESDEPIAIE